MVDVRQLFDFDRLARKDVARYPRRRDLFGELMAEGGRHTTGVVGPRGVGKTILLKQLAVALPDSFYLSVDVLGRDDLFAVCQALQERYGIRVLLLDEVHFQRDYRLALKKVFDFLPVRVVFTSSVSLSLFESGADLSRRVKLSMLYPFSFREFVSFRAGIELPPLSLSDLAAARWTPEHLRQEYLFDEYLRGGLMPFALEEPDVMPLLRNMVQKVVAGDIPAVTRLAVDELPLIHKCLEFVGRSAVDGINYSSLSRNVGITKYKAEAYVSLLAKAFILNPVLPTGTNVLREPKILMGLPYRLLYSDAVAAIGGLREDFFAETMRMRGLGFHYLKSTRGAKTPDYLVQTDGGDMVIEVGGKGKGREQFKGVQAAKAMVLAQALETRGLRRPLFLLGFV